MVAQAVRARSGVLVEQMLARFVLEVPHAGVQDDPDVAAAMRESCHANLHASLAELGRTRRSPATGAPSGALEEARTTAQAGVPLDALLQTYRIGHAVAWEAIVVAISEMDRLTEPQRTDLLLRCSRYAFAYVDRVMPVVAAEHTQERDRLIRGRAQRRAQLVRDAIDGTPVDSGELGYDLSGQHRAAIGWGRDGEAALLQLATTLGTRPLVISAAGQTVWGWVGGRHDDQVVRRASAALDLTDGGLALSNPATGPGGFSESHHQARRARRIGVATGAQVVHFADVSLECLMLVDETAARSFVAAELAPLDIGRDGSKLRDTLTAYFASGFNASAAAAALNVNDRTVAYRLNTIEERLGRPVRTRHAELHAAIRVERILQATTSVPPAVRETTARIDEGAASASRQTPDRR
jgi:PucR C-terminal helix-turn-helix domain/GGDEF-like domain